MRIIHKNLKLGEIKVKIENLDDLWYLSQIIEIGNSLRGSTTRKIIRGEKSEKAKVERKRVFLSIEAEKIDFEEINVLRVLGKVNSDCDDVGKGSHHSFELEEGTEICIVKNNWPSYQLKLIKDSVNTKSTKILICVMDREHAVFAKMKKDGFEVLSDIKGDVQKKEDRNNSTKGFYLEIGKKLEDYNKRENYDAIVVASPAFFKDDFMKTFNSELKKKITLSGCSNVNKSGINEVLKRAELAKVIQNDKAAREINLVEKILSEISKGGKVAYGLKEVVNAVNLGAVEFFLITDSFINSKRKEGKFRLVDKTMKNVESLRAEIHIISSAHDGGKKLDGLGGVAALLRFRI